MSLEERRGRERCSVCQGPTKDDGQGLRCRNSLCPYNHKDQACTRCGQADFVVSLVQGLLQYKCNDCLHVWQKVQLSKD